jgi:hypothetical protein
MPYSIRKIGKNKYQVYNTATGELHSKGTTKKKAEGQFRLLQGIHRKELLGDLEGGMNRRVNWTVAPIERRGTLPPIANAPTLRPPPQPRPRPRFYTKLAKDVA